MQSAKKDNSTSVYRHYLNCCGALGAPGMERAVDQMIVLDYLIANEDRHQNNFGLIRDANTLYGWLDFDRLNGVENEICKVFDQAGDYMDEARKSAILSAFSSRLGNLMALSEGAAPSGRY